MMDDANDLQETYDEWVKKFDEGGSRKALHKVFARWRSFFFIFAGGIVGGLPGSLLTNNFIIPGTFAVLLLLHLLWIPGLSMRRRQVMAQMLLRDPSLVLEFFNDLLGCDSKKQEEAVLRDWYDNIQEKGFTTWRRLPKLFW